MSKSGYKSKKTSPQKHKSRWMFYGDIPVNVLQNRTHILIPSEDCGDIDVLCHWLEVDKSKILAADLDPLAVAEAYRRGVTVTCEDVLVVLERALNAGRNIGSLNLDFCASPIATVDSLAIALRANIPYVMYTFAERTGRKRKDGTSPPMRTRADRYKFIVDRVGQKPVAHWPYKSISKYDKGSAMYCMVFRGNGHLPKSLYSTSNPAPTKESRRTGKGVRRCSLCDRPGHYAPTCDALWSAVE